MRIGCAVLFTVPSYGKADLSFKSIPAIPLLGVELAPVSVAGIMTVGYDKAVAVTTGGFIQVCRADT